METPMSKPVQAGPLPVVSRVITPLIGVISPQLPIYKANQKGYNSVYNWFLGPPCAIEME